MLALDCWMCGGKPRISTFFLHLQVYKELQEAIALTEEALYGLQDTEALQHAQQSTTELATIEATVPDVSTSARIQPVCIRVLSAVFPYVLSSSTTI